MVVGDNDVIHMSSGSETLQVSPLQRQAFSGRLDPCHLQGVGVGEPHPVPPSRSAQPVAWGIHGSGSRGWRLHYISWYGVTNLILLCCRPDPPKAA